MRKAKFTTKIDRNLLGGVCNAVWHIGRGLTVSAVVEEALSERDKEIEQQHDRGKPSLPGSADFRFLTR